MKNLIIQVTFMAGIDIKKAGIEALELAKQLDCTITFAFNGVTCSVMPNSSADVLAKEFEKAYVSKHQIKMAFG